MSDAPVLFDLSQTLKPIRRQRALTQAELAVKADLNVATVLHLERGHHLATPTTLRKLAKALRVSLARLSGEAAS